MVSSGKFEEADSMGPHMPFQGVIFYNRKHPGMGVLGTL